MKIKNLRSIEKELFSIIFLLLIFGKLLGQEQESNVNNFVFDCNNCNSAGPDMALSISPSENSFTTLPETTVTLYLQGADADINCISTNQVIGEGPYKMEFMIDGDATFDTNGANFIEVTPILGANGAIWLSGQIDLTVSSDWDGSIIFIEAKFIDNEVPVNCSNDCGNANDEDKIHNWAVTQQFSPCPDEVNFTSLSLPALFIVSNSNDPAFFTLGTGAAGTYINEEVIDLSPNFMMNDIDSDWLAAHPAVMTPTDVINTVLPPDNFVGGGFVMDNQGNFVDSYFVSHNLIPFTQAALQNTQKGFSMVHTYSCNNGIIHTHNSQFKFNVVNVEARITQ